MSWKLEDTCVAIIGAGFSAACTNGEMPLMRSYFDQLDVATFPVLYDFVSSVAGSTATANVESVLLALDQIRSSPDRLLMGWADRWKVRVGEIHRELASYTLFRLSECREVDDDNWAATAMQSFTERTTVLSMNYDNIAESLLSNRDGMFHYGPKLNCPHCKMRLLLQKACSCEGRNDAMDLPRSDWQGAILKLHGSIAWKRCLNSACCSFECLVAHEKCQPFEPCNCPTCGQPCGPVLVMPAMSKNLNEIPEIGIMWQAARLAISNASTLLFFGFSMPPSDELLIQLIRSAVHDSNTLRRVVSIDLSPDAVLERFRKCISLDTSVELVSLQVDRNETPSWFSEVCSR